MIRKTCLKFRSFNREYKTSGCDEVLKILTFNKNVTLIIAMAF